jgi:hypothetical protein
MTRCTMSAPAGWATEEDAIFVLDMTTTQRIKPNKKCYADHSAKSCAYQRGATSSTYCHFQHVILHGNGTQRILERTAMGLREADLGILSEFGKQGLDMAS